MCQILCSTMAHCRHKKSVRIWEINRLPEEVKRWSPCLKRGAERVVKNDPTACTQPTSTSYQHEIWLNWFRTIIRSRRRSIAPFVLLLVHRLWNKRGIYTIPFSTHHVITDNNTKRLPLSYSSSRVGGGSAFATVGFSSSVFPAAAAAANAKSK